MQNKETKLKLLLVIDEAVTLVDWGYFPAMRWVLEEVIDEKDFDFLAVFLGTSSKVSNFMPHPVKASARLLPQGTTATATPFLSLPWDLGLQSYKGTLANMARFDNLVYYGRPLWQSIWMDKSQHLKPLSLIELAQAKLLARNPRHEIDDPDPTKKKLLEACALLGIRVGLNVDIGAPSRASEMVASHMRWLGGIGHDRQKLYTGYGSEPVLVEAAATLLNSDLSSITKKGKYKELTDRHATYKAVLKLIVKELSQGYIAPGEHGELTTRIICILL
jgi:hypothetical protein